jgi:hypothetical protein
MAPSPILALNRLIPALAGHITLREFRALYFAVKMEVGERYQDLSDCLSLAQPLFPSAIIAGSLAWVCPALSGSTGAGSG